MSQTNTNNFDFSNFDAFEAEAKAKYEKEIEERKQKEEDQENKKPTYTNRIKADKKIRFIEILSGDGGVNIIAQKEKMKKSLDDIYLGISSKNHERINPLANGRENQFVSIGATDGLRRDAKYGEACIMSYDPILGTVPAKIFANWIKPADVLVNTITVGGGTSTSVGTTVNEIAKAHNEKVSIQANSLEANGDIYGAETLRTSRKLVINLMSLPFDVDIDSRSEKNIEYAKNNICKKSNYMVFDQNVIAKHCGGQTHELVLPSLTLAQHNVITVIKKITTYEPAEGIVGTDFDDLKAMAEMKGKSIIYAGSGKSPKEAYDNAFIEIRKFDETASDKFVQGVAMIFEYKNNALRTAKAIQEETSIRLGIKQNAGSGHFDKSFHSFKENLNDDVVVSFMLTGINTDTRSDNQVQDDQTEEKALSQALTKNKSILKQIQGDNLVIESSEVISRVETATEKRRMTQEQISELGGVKKNQGEETYRVRKEQILKEIN
jgi:hypothetical protein